MINWFKKLYSEGRWGFWSLMFLFPIPMVIGILDVAFYWDLNFQYGWFFALFIVFAVMQERELSQKERIVLSKYCNSKQIHLIFKW